MASQDTAGGFKDTFATNTTSKFTDFSLKLRNGATLTGIAYVPVLAEPTEEITRPLVVGIHGATCSAYGYDVSPNYTASRYSDLLSIPFVAFHRPNFLGSSGWIVDRSSEPAKPQLEASQGLTFFQEEAHWYHELIFPALWEEFAVPNRCNSMVTTSHSMSVPPTIIAGGLFSASQRPPSYLWAGMVLSGFAEERTEVSQNVSKALPQNQYTSDELPSGQDPDIHYPPYRQSDKQRLMLGPVGLCDNELRPLIWKQNTPFLQQEVLDLIGMWPSREAEYKAAVKIPVLYGLGEYDWLWKGVKSNVDSFCTDFSACPRIEGAVVTGAPHAIELSRVSEGWWLRIFGWATEVTAGSTMRSMKPLYEY